MFLFEYGGIIVYTYYMKELDDFMNKCANCGLCMRVCPVTKYTTLKNQTPAQIQKRMQGFLEGEPADEFVLTRVLSCMECFKCNDVCPHGINPLAIVEHCKNELKKREIKDLPYQAPDDIKAPQRILANVQVTKEEYRRITKIDDKNEVKYVFFPGCNVYQQPEKILNSLDILNQITNDFVFVPGLDYCCGDAYLYAGDIEKGCTAFETLHEKISCYNPETLILWCPTCLCRFNNVNVEYEIISLPQFIMKNIEKLLPQMKSLPHSVTLHEACKAAYTGLDLNGPRDLLKKIPDIELRELKHHGKNTSCCGSGAITFFPEVFAKVRDERLMEAEETGAQYIVDICHFCHETFVREESKFSFEVINYINLLCKCCGFDREDKFKKYSKWNNLERICSDINMNRDDLIYTREEIIETLKKTFIR